MSEDNLITRLMVIGAAYSCRDEHIKRDEIARAADDARIRIAALEAALNELQMTAGWARNRLELMADEAWHGDGRDLKRSLVGMFKEFDEALAKHGIPRAEEARAALEAGQ